MPCLLGQPHCPFLEEEQPVAIKLTSNVSINVILNSFCIYLSGYQIKLFSQINIALFG
jgi:hypothetical protein